MTARKYKSIEDCDYEIEGLNIAIGILRKRRKVVYDDRQRTLNQIIKLNSLAPPRKELPDLIDNVRIVKGKNYKSPLTN